MGTIDKLEEMVDAYFHVYKEFGGVIHRADKQPTTLFDIVDEPRFKDKGRLSNFAYGLSCAICSKTVYSKDRVKLVAKGEVRTLCEEHLDKVGSLRKAISDAHRKVDKAIKLDNKAQAKAIRWEWRREHKQRTSI